MGVLHRRCEQSLPPFRYRGAPGILQTASRVEPEGLQEPQARGRNLEVEESYVRAENISKTLAGVPHRSNDRSWTAPDPVGGYRLRGT